MSLSISGTESVSREPHVDLLSSIFRRCVAAIVGTKITSEQATMENAAFEIFVMLGEMRMQELFSSLLKFANVQRRLQPSLEDVALLLTSHNINICDLEAEIGRLDPTSCELVSQLNHLPFTGETEPLSEAESLFFEQSRSIMTQNRHAPRYAPSWVPTLPADHTYMKTPKFTNSVHTLQTLRERVFEEGQLAELALQRLLGSSGSTSVVQVLEPNEVAKITKPINFDSLSGGELEDRIGQDADGYDEDEMEVDTYQSEAPVEEDNHDQPLVNTAGQPVSSLDAAESANTELGAQLGAELGGPKDLAELGGPPVDGPIKTEEGFDDGSTETPSEIGVHIKLRLPKLKSSESDLPTDEVSSQPSHPKLRLSLAGLNQNKRTAASEIKVSMKQDLYGKRPRLDIERLALQSRSEGQDNDEEQNDSPKPTPTTAKASASDELFTRALMSVI